MTGFTFRALALAAVLAAGNSLAADAIAARDHLNQGVNAYKTADYAKAADEFRLAIDADPTFGVARLYLATAYQQQFVPGVDTPDNRKYWQSAMDEFQNVLRDQPSESNRLLATQSVASLYFQGKDMANAVDWTRKVLELDANNKEAYYTLGVIAWLTFLPEDRAARAELSMQPADPGPLRPDAKNTKAELRARYWQSLTEGIGYENKALALDPSYENAMSYQNLLIRYRADLDDSQEAYDGDVHEADIWMSKALATTRAKAARNAAADTGVR